METLTLVLLILACAAGVIGVFRSGGHDLNAWGIVFIAAALLLPKVLSQ
jgi:hypothetical protein